MAEQYRGDSVYRNTEIVDNKYLGMYSPTVTDTSKYNTYPLVIEAKHDKRPDVLAYELYGNPRLWWVFAMFNQDELVDPIIDFTAGKEIKVPTKFS